MDCFDGATDMDASFASMSVQPVSREKARWITIVFFFLSGIITATWASRIPDIQKKLALNDAQWGGVLFALPAGLVMGLPLSSWVVSKYGSRRMMVITSVVFAITLCLLGIVDRTWLLVLTLFLFGMLRNATNISINTHSLEVQKLYEKPIISTFHGTWSLACFLAAGAGTLMIAAGVEPSAHFVFMAGLCVLFCFFFRSKKEEVHQAHSEKRPFFIRPDRYLFMLGLIAFCSMICEGAMFDWSVNYFDKVVQTNEETATTGYTSFIIAMAIGRLAGDKVIANYGATSMLIVNGLLMAAGFLIAIIFPYLVPASAGFLLVGLGDSIVIPIVYVFAGQSKAMPAAYAIASVTMIGYAGFLAGPPVIGTISEHFGMQWAFALMAVMSLGITVITMLVRSRQHELVTKQ